MVALSSGAAALLDHPSLAAAAAAANDNDASVPMDADDGGMSVPLEYIPALNAYVVH
jgi:hypothetical protein